jgi:hypothetical protein
MNNYLGRNETTRASLARSRRCAKTPVRALTTSQFYMADAALLGHRSDIADFTRSLRRRDFSKTRAGLIHCGDLGALPDDCHSALFEKQQPALKL